MPDDKLMPPEPSDESKGVIGRLNAIPGRPLLLIAVGAILAVLLLFAPGSCSGVDIEERHAIATARAELDAHPDAFTPDRTEAKVLRQGFPPAPMWVVVFTVQDPDGGPEDFLHHAAIWVHAGTGEIREVQVGGTGDN
jgi:hypothetical protein